MPVTARRQPNRRQNVPMTDTLTITVIEPEELAPVGRLGEWLFAEGASLRMVRPSPPGTRSATASLCWAAP